jgi:hypothetical protein
LVKKEVKWQWTIKEETAFRELQRAIINAPVSSPTTVEVVGYRINPVDNAQGNDNSLIDKD